MSDHEIDLGIENTNSDIDLSLNTNSNDIGLSLDSSSNAIDLQLDTSTTKPISLSLDSVTENEIDLQVEDYSNGGTTNYEKLSNKPSINNVTLLGNKTGEDLGPINIIDSASFKEVQDLIDNLM